jgi:glucose-1-phosphate adenylyltransferase
MFGIIYAGTVNKELGDLVAVRTSAAVPVFGRYRAIDFILSNMTKSKIKNIALITNKNYLSLFDHLGFGHDFGIPRKSGGLFFMSPDAVPENKGDYRGMLDALASIRSYITERNEDYAVITGVHQIYKINFNEVLNYHINSNADMTAIFTPHKSSATKFDNVKFEMNTEGRITGMEIDSLSPSFSNQSAETIIVKKNYLLEIIDETVSQGKFSFNRDFLLSAIKTKRVMGYAHTGYIGRMDSVKEYYDMNMDMLIADNRKELFDVPGGVYKKIKNEVPARYTGTSDVKNSLIADGCIIEGEVKNSVLFRKVHVKKGAVVKNSILLQGVTISSGASVNNMILDKNVFISEGKILSSESSYPLIIKKGVHL